MTLSGRNVVVTGAGILAGAVMAFGAGGCADERKPESIAIRRVEMSPSFLTFKHTEGREIRLSILESGPEGFVIEASDREPVTEQNSRKFRVKPDGRVELWNWRYEEFFTDLPADQNR